MAELQQQKAAVRMIVRRRTAIAACLLVALTPVSAGISPGRLRVPRIGEVHRQDAEVSSPREHWVQRLLRLLAPSGNNALRRSLVKSAGWLRSPTVAAAIAATASYRTHLRSVAQKRKVQQGLRAELDSCHLTIVTTAALPWMTGTAVNPLLRAAHLAQAGRRVTLVVPWLHPSEQHLVFAAGVRFEAPSEQEDHIRSWLRERAGLSDAEFELRFYPSRYDMERGSILPLGDISRFIDEEWGDICVLEEPEHLTWYHNGQNWRHRFKLVIGVVHTNYLYYAKTWDKGGELSARVVGKINEAVCRAYCDHVIKLSDTLQPLPRAVVCNVHGVRSEFLAVGQQVAEGPAPFPKGAYFLGKVLWAKGHRLLLDYLQLEGSMGLPPTHVDLYGSGEDIEEVRGEAEAKRLDVSFYPATDHAGPLLRDYKVFVNPSLSEVLSTTTAEALAMGKFVVIQRHPSNAFFLSFANTLPFSSAEEFLQQAPPRPTSPDLARSRPISPDSPCRSCGARSRARLPLSALRSATASHGRAPAAR